MTVPTPSARSVSEAEKALNKTTSGFDFGKAEKEHAKGDWDFSQLRNWMLDVIANALDASERETRKADKDAVRKELDACMKDGLKLPQLDELALRNRLNNALSEAERRGMKEK